MREYDDYDDDSIRLYTPVLQRVIILAAVVIAVPVLMWTITTFVRSYVARPKAPLLEHVASTSAPTRIPLLAVPPGPAPVAADQSAPPSGDSAASEAPNPTGEINTGAVAAVPDSNPSPSAATGPSTASLPAAPTQSPSPAIPGPAATGDAANGSNPAATAAAVPASPPRQTLRATDGTASSDPSSSDRGIAWPNPNATNPPDFAAPRLAPSPPPPAARTATTEAFPADEPLHGPVPLPRQRPSIFAMAATMPANMAANTPARGGPVPLPRARPGDASDTGTIAETPVSGRGELENAH